MSTADRNFTVKLTLKEANVVRKALKRYHEELTSKTIAAMTDDEKEEVGRMDKMLRIDF